MTLLSVPSLVLSQKLFKAYKHTYHVNFQCSFHYYLIVVRLITSWSCVLSIQTCKDDKISILVIYHILCIQLPIALRVQPSHRRICWNLENVRLLRCLGLLLDHWMNDFRTWTGMCHVYVLLPLVLFLLQTCILLSTIQIPTTPLKN